VFFPEEVVNVPKGEEDLTKCCNTESCPARRRNEINRVLEEELENLMHQSRTAAPAPASPRPFYSSLSRAFTFYANGE